MNDGLCLRHVRACVRAPALFTFVRAPVSIMLASCASQHDAQQELLNRQLEAEEKKAQQLRLKCMQWWCRNLARFVEQAHARGDREAAREWGEQRSMCEVELSELVVRLPPDAVMEETTPAEMLVPANALRDSANTAEDKTVHMPLAHHCIEPGGGGDGMRGSELHGHGDSGASNALNVPGKAGEEGASVPAEEVDEEARRRAEEDAEVEMEVRRAMFVAEMKRIQMEQEREGVLAHAQVEESELQEMKIPADSEEVERVEDKKVARRPFKGDERTMDAIFGAEVLRAENDELTGKAMEGMEGNEQDKNREIEQQERGHDAAVAVDMAADEKRQMEAKTVEMSLQKKEEQRLKLDAEAGVRAREERDGKIVLSCAQSRLAIQTSIREPQSSLPVDFPDEIYWPTDEMMPARGWRAMPIGAGSSRAAG